VGGRIIVQQEKISRRERSWTTPLNGRQEAIHYSFIKFCIYCFSLWYEFFVHYALKIEKIINMVLMRDLWSFSCVCSIYALPLVVTGERTVPLLPMQVVTGYQNGYPVPGVIAGSPCSGVYECG